MQAKLQELGLMIENDARNFLDKETPSTSVTNDRLPNRSMVL